jgi:hypothetical protein
LRVSSAGIIEAATITVKPIRRYALVLTATFAMLSGAAPSAQAGAHPARLFRLVELTQGRLLVSVRRPARLTISVNGHRLERQRLARGRVYEFPVHRRGRIRLVAVAGSRRQTVILHTG